MQEPAEKLLIVHVYTYNIKHALVWNSYVFMQQRDQDQHCDGFFTDHVRSISGSKVCGQDVSVGKIHQTNVCLISTVLDFCSSTATLCCRVSENFCGICSTDGVKNCQSFVHIWHFHIFWTLFNRWSEKTVNLLCIFDISIFSGLCSTEIHCGSSSSAHAPCCHGTIYSSLWAKSEVEYVIFHLWELLILKLNLGSFDILHRKWKTIMGMYDQVINAKLHTVSNWELSIPI